MSKISNTVLRETCRVCLWLLALSAVMELVYVFLGRWSMGVLLGNLLGAGVAAINFFLLGLTVQKALDMPDQKRAGAVRLSQMLRLLMQGLALVVAMTVKSLDPVATILPLFFPQLPIRLRAHFDQKKSIGGDSLEE